MPGNVRPLVYGENMKTARVGQRVMHVTTKTVGRVEEVDMDAVTGVLLRVRVRPETATALDAPRRLAWWRAEKAMEVMG